MSDNNYDEKQTHKPKTPQTPFGGWGNQAASGDDASGGPRPVVSNEDGSQRPADSNELSMPKYDAQEGVKSFSATFGAVKEETPEEKANQTFAAPVDIPAPEEDFTFAAPTPAAENEDTGPSEYKYTFSTLDDSGAPLEETTALTPPEPAPAAEPQFTQPAPLDPNDPFAWSPEEAPAADEPRRQAISGETWMATDTSYEDLQNASTAEEAAQADNSGEVIEEEPEPVVNPFMFGKEEGFKAPPMDASLMEDSSSKKNFEFSDNTQAEAAETEDTPTEPDAPASPFDFAAFNEEEDTTPATPEPAAQPADNAAFNMPENGIENPAVEPAPEAEHLGTAETEFGDHMMGESDDSQEEAPVHTPTPLLAEEPTQPAESQTPVADFTPEAPAEEPAPAAEKKTTFQAYRPSQPVAEDAATGNEADDFMTATPAPVAETAPLPEAPAAEESSAPLPIMETAEEPAAQEQASDNPFAMPAPETAETTDTAETLNLASQPEDTGTDDTPFALDAQQQPEAPEATEEAPQTEDNPFALQTPPPAPPLPEEANPFAAAPEALEDFQPEDTLPPADVNTQTAAEEDAPLPESMPMQSWDAPTEEPAQPVESGFDDNAWSSPAETEQPLPAPETHDMPIEEAPALGEAGTFTEETADSFAADTAESAWSQEPPQEQQADAWANQEDNTFAAQADTPAENEWQQPTDTAAASQTPEDVQAILQGHVLWLNSDGKDGRRANFRNANLQGVDLSNNQLTEASFRGANLQGASLSGCDMRGADLSEAMLSGASLTSSSLAGAIFSRADARQAQFHGSDLQGADFSNAQLSGTDLQQLNLASAVFLEADMQGANLTQSSLIGANLRGANLTGANLTGANLSSANCRDVQFAQATLDYAVFEGANLKNTNLQSASLLGADLSSAGDSSPEQRQDTLLAEKEQLAQEWQRVKEYEAQVQGLQTSLQQREMTLQSERMNAERARREVRAQHESMEQLMHKTHQVMQRHRVHDRLFKYFGVTWFLFTILAAVSVMMFVNALQLGSLSWLELAIVFGGCTLIMGLFIATTVRSIKLSNNLKQLLDSYAQLIPNSTNEQ